MKYILLYIPWVSISLSSLAYYRFGETYQLSVVANGCNMLSFLCLFILIGLLSANKVKHSMPFKVQAQHMAGFIVFPKFLQHIFSVFGVYGFNVPFDAYHFNHALMFCMVFFILTTPIRIFLIKRNKRFGLE